MDNEIDNILKKPATNNKLQDIIKKYKEELKNFIYIENEIEAISLKDAYIRYVGINGLLNNGGIYYKCIKENGHLFILLINKNKKPWKVKFDENYIFYTKRIRNNNSLQRDIFMQFLEKFS